MTFDLVHTPLDFGVTRLEASAGTGKTYALAGIFLRLLVEENIPASDILVVTFTEAATAELRDRIRRRLTEALLALEGHDTKDELLIELVARTRDRRESAVNSLRNALEIFDLISISTIHGFCQRTLQDGAFESGSLFNVELVADQAALIREVAADYFRRQTVPRGALIASAALHQNLTPDVFAVLLKRFLTYPELKLLPAEPAKPLDKLAADLETAFAACAAEWKKNSAGRQTLVDYFTGGKKWVTKEHAKPEIIQARLEILDAALASGNFFTEFWDAVEFFSISKIRAAVGKKKEMPPPPTKLFDACETLLASVKEFALAQRLDFLNTARAALAKRKQETKQQSYDDLIGQLAAALSGASGAALARSVRKKFRAALIDESQDTDPLQWKIFRDIFAGSAAHRLFLIGDPKQAIYGFRGADVHTYLRAAESARAKYSLDTNWRSESALVGAVNTIFESAGKNVAFVEEEISFAPVKAVPKADAEPLVFENGNRPPPLQVWTWGTAGGALSAKSAQNILPAAVAAEVSRLLRENVSIGGRKINPRDIAVLVESHRQAGWIQAALHGLRIPSVEQAMDSVFASGEARELQWILAAVLHPARESAVKCALTTDAFGFDANRLQMLVANEVKWRERLQTFSEYRASWERDGFYFMFSELLRREKIVEILLRFPDAERRVTNFLHLAELLATAARMQHLGATRLAQWLEKRRAGDEADAEEFQLRLESDDDAVQIVTVHRSKGLEYPVVFCPFVSKDASLRPIKANGKNVLETVLFHDAATGEMTWDLNSPPDAGHEQQAAKELLAEKVRLLYVALTRARHRCYLAAVPYRKKNSVKQKSTALAWLLSGQKENLGNPVEFLEAQDANPADWKNRWLAVAEKSPAAIAVDDVPLEAGEIWEPEKSAAEKLAPKICAREIQPAWFLSSFTQLSQQAFASHETAAPDLPDYDAIGSETKLAEAEEAPAEGIFALPAGARTGDCLHQILEQFDFAGDNAKAAAALVKQQLAAFGLDEARYVAAVSEILERLRRVPLDLKTPDFTLARVTPEKRLSEMEFHFPTGALDAEQLVKIVRDQKVSAAKPPHIEGFLKGFIDLIFEFGGRFYIVDWKSNSLGRRDEDYNQAAMWREIAERGYDLQYHLYTVALDKYLRTRLAGYDYEKHFGGVRYIFLRGVTPEKPELGIFSDRPVAEKIARLAAMFGNFAEAKP
jgi:exodeoxyribonuclease V beta subunit